MTETSEVLRLPHLFFLSYAHASGSHPSSPPRQPNKEINEFFDRLSEDVAGLVSRPMGEDPGFLDRSIPSGARWHGELLRIVGTCQVFIALLSYPYFSSDWCGKEWHAFSQREATMRDLSDEKPTAILPVIWAPFTITKAPQVVRDAQLFSPTGLPNVDVVAQYERFGIFGLMRTQQLDAYHGVVWQLAQWIADFHHACEVPPSIAEPGNLRNAFKENGP